MRQGWQSSPSAGDAKRAHSMSISSASPQSRQSTADCGGTPTRHTSQIGSSVARASGPPQTRQSEGNTVATRSSTIEESDWTVRSVRTRSRLKRARPESNPAPKTGGAPGEAWSVLSFRLSLKMHLAQVGAPGRLGRDDGTSINAREAAGQPRVGRVAASGDLAFDSLSGDFIELRRKLAVGL